MPHPSVCVYVCLCVCISVCVCVCLCVCSTAEMVLGNFLRRALLCRLGDSWQRPAPLWTSARLQALSTWGGSLCCVWSVSFQIQWPPCPAERTRETPEMLLHFFLGWIFLCDGVAFVPCHVTPADLVIVLGDGELSVSSSPCWVKAHGEVPWCFQNTI